MSAVFLEKYTVLITILMTLFVSRVKTSMHTNIVTVWIANFAGTFFHELAHLIVSAVFNGKPIKISLFPKKEGNGYTLGYVESSNITWYNAFPIAMAPFLLLIIVYFIYNDFFNFMELNTLNYLIYLFLLVSFLDSAIPSGQDFKVAFSNFGFLIYFLLLGLWCYYNCNQYFYNFNFLSQKG